MNTDTPVAVADLHGRLDLLDALISRFADRKLVLLGDYMDRGPDSAGVLKRVRELVSRGQAQALLGNHDLMVIHVMLKGGHPGNWREKNGGQATLDSYVNGPGIAQLIDDAQWMQRWLKETLVIGDTLLSHAMRPDPRPGGDEDLHLWARPTDPDAPVWPLPAGVTRSVHGHTPLENAPVRMRAPDGTDMHFLDAGVVLTGRLGWYDARNGSSGVVTMQECAQNA